MEMIKGVKAPEIQSSLAEISRSFLFFCVYAIHILYSEVMH